MGGFRDTGPLLFIRTKGLCGLRGTGAPRGIGYRDTGKAMFDLAGQGTEYGCLGIVALAAGGITAIGVKCSFFVITAGSLVNNEDWMAMGFTKPSILREGRCVR